MLPISAGQGPAESIEHCRGHFISVVLWELEFVGGSAFNDTWGTASDALEDDIIA